jgi:TolB protein
MALHGVSDEIGSWIFGQRGAAQTHILYGYQDNIWSIDSDGANSRRLTTAERGEIYMSPAWHPSGTKFAYVGLQTRGSQVGIFDLTTSESYWNTATVRGLNLTPTFSPDGRTMVYANGRENGTDIVTSEVGSSPFVRRLTVGRGSDNTSPVFSPDGRQIAFMSGRAGHPEIYVMDADGTNVQLLTEYNYDEGTYRASPAWSPDGRMIAYQSRVRGEFQIMTIDLRDKSTKQYTSEGINEDPDWSPDARHVAFSSTRSGVRQLWVVDVESGRLRQLTHHAGARLAAWSPILKSQEIVQGALKE